MPAPGKGAFIPPAFTQDGRLIAAQQPAECRLCATCPTNGILAADGGARPAAVGTADNPEFGALPADLTALRAAWQQYSHTIKAEYAISAAA